MQDGQNLAKGSRTFAAAFREVKFVLADEVSHTESFIRDPTL